MKNLLKTERTADRLDALRLLVGLLAVMWIVEIVNSIDHQHLDGAGIRPRRLAGLDGIVFSPFLHASFGHLIANTVPFVILGAAVAVSGLAQFAKVTVIVAVVAGLGTWLTASSNSITVGASGIVFGYAAFLVSRGFFNRNFTQLALGAIVGVVFGGALLWSLIPHSGVSWQDHLFGAIGGVVAAGVLSDKTGRNRALAPSARTS